MERDREMRKYIMAGRITGSTPKKDGYHMPGEFEKQKCIWMIWPERPDNWRSNAGPARKAFSEVAKAISQFEPVIMLSSKAQFADCRKQLPEEIQVLEMESNDAWARDIGPSFLINNEEKLRACDWTFNAWGGDVDGLYKPWDKDDRIASQICEKAGVDFYRTEGFVLEGGAFHLDGEGTILTVEMCLLSKGRNPSLSKEQIEQKLCDYLGGEKVIWLKDGIDPLETNGHIDDVACFVSPKEVACIFTEDKDHPFYQASQDAYRILREATDAKGRQLKVHKICCTKKNIYIEKEFVIEKNNSSIKRMTGDLCIASYLNFLIVNGGVIVPQYGDENDALALAQIQEIFPDRKAIGVYTREIVYGGGNIHCITQQQPAGK